MRFKLLSTFITALLPLVRSDFSFEVKNYVACGMLEVEYSGANGSPNILIVGIYYHSHVSNLIISSPPVVILRILQC